MSDEVRAAIRSVVRDGPSGEDKLEEPATLRKTGPAACDMFRTRKVVQ
jgi:hypothetical protein